MLDFESRPVVKPIEIEPYLKRLGVYKELPSLGFLRKIHRNHLLSIPFENLDVHVGNQIILDIDKIYEKIISRGRGGFCYELNLLFYHLLIHLGYECQLISCSVWKAEIQKYGPEYDHMAILIKLQNDVFLCDVGFGDGFVYPQKVAGDLQMDMNRYFKIFKDRDDNFYLKMTDGGDQFLSKYRFKVKRREPIEFIDMCTYHQSSPESTFVAKKLITRLDQTGRITLTDDKLIYHEKGMRHEESVLNDDAFYAKMEEHFGISYQALLQR